MVYFLSIELPALFEMAEEDDMDTANCLKDFDGLEHVIAPKRRWSSRQTFWQDILGNMHMVRLQTGIQ